jgi:hypothetical protein
MRGGAVGALGETLPMSPKRAGGLVRPVLVLVLWAGAIAAGFGALVAYEGAPGTSGPALARWPADTAFEAPSDRSVVLVFLHPQCACSQATADGLEKLATRLPTGWRAVAAFYRPHGSDADWAETGLRARVARVPGLLVVDDVGGVEAERFGARTSGHVVAFDFRGRRLFAGGITGARGHVGDNAHLDSLIAALRDETPAAGEAEVFGCPLTSAEANGGA